jgi:delta-aminolevulinic acid dehydratase/porphobilinogen synthase
MLKARHNGRCGESTTRVMTEVLTSIKRAGADLIITYFALEFAEGSRR